MIAYSYCFLVEIDRQVIERDHILSLKGFPADDGSNACSQLGQIKRFGQVIVGAGLKSGHFIVQRVFCRHDKHAINLIVFLQCRKDLQAISIGKSDIQNDARIIIKRYLFHRRPEIERFFTDKLLFIRQVVAHALRKLLLILYDQYFHDLENRES